jgi:hypothetical protein
VRRAGFAKGCDGSEKVTSYSLNLARFMHDFLVCEISDFSVYIE